MALATKGKPYYNSFTYPQLDNSDLSTGEMIEHPEFLRKSAEKLAKLQQRLSLREKHSRPWKILKSRIAKLHQHIARARLDSQFKLAYSLFEKGDVLIIEDLKLKNLTRRAKPKIDQDGTWLRNNKAAKSELNKLMLDAAHGQLIQALKFVAWKLGKTVKEVNPSGTSQHCWNCLNRVPKELKDRWHSCPCGEQCHPDENSAHLIKRIGIVGMDVASLKTALGISNRSLRSIA